MPAPMEFGVIDYRYAVRAAVAAGFRGAFCTEHYGGDYGSRQQLKHLPTTFPSRRRSDGRLFGLADELHVVPRDGSPG